MKFIYNAERSPISDDTEGHIRNALLELGHTVSEDGDGDFYLYHKKFEPPQKFSGKTIMWYFDKISFTERRELDFWEMASHSDHLFITDGSYSYPDAQVLRQGIGTEGKRKPVVLEDIRAEIAFVGSVYGERMDFVRGMSRKYGRRFAIFENYHGSNLADLCATVPVFVAPEYPCAPGYWSNRIYLTLGNGGFLLHPWVEGIEKEYTDGVHLVLYRTLEDLHEKIAYYLEHPAERERIRKAGQKKTVEDYSFIKRCSRLLTLLNTGTSA